MTEARLRKFLVWLCPTQRIGNYTIYNIQSMAEGKRILYMSLTNIRKEIEAIIIDPTDINRIMAEWEELYTILQHL